MKTPSSELFAIIKSMTRQEKVYFKINSTKNGQDSGYIKLFNVVNKMEIYDEKKIRKKLDGEPVVNNLKRSKSYLIEAILKNLTDFHSGGSVDSILFESIQRAEILKQKQLYKTANKIITKAERVAVENERYPYLFLILQLKLTLIESSKNSGSSFEINVNDHYKQIFDQLALFRSNLQYRKLNQYFAVLRGSNVIINMQLRRKLKQMIKDPLLADERIARTYESRKLMYNTLENIYGKLGNWKMAASFSKKNLELFGSVSSRRWSFSINYLVTGHNYLLAMTKLRNFREFNLWYDKMMHFYSAIESKERNAESRAWILKMRLLSISNYINFFKLDDALSAAYGLKKTFDKTLYEDKFIIAVLYYKFFIIHFLRREYKNAIQWLNKIINLGDNDTSREIFEMSRFLLIICHFESGNYDILKYLIQTTSRYLEKRSGMLEFQKELMVFFNNISSEKGMTKDSLILAHLHMKKIMNSDLGANILEVFDFISWLESKIEDRPFAAVIKEKQSRKKLL